MNVVKRKLYITLTEKELDKLEKLSKINNRSKSNMIGTLILEKD